jgi:hypothetical protein
MHGESAVHYKHLTAILVNPLVRRRGTLHACCAMFAELANRRTALTVPMLP